MKNIRNLKISREKKEEVQQEEINDLPSTQDQAKVILDNIENKNSHKKKVKFSIKFPKKLTKKQLLILIPIVFGIVFLGVFFFIKYDLITKFRTQKVYEEVLVQVSYGESYAPEFDYSSVSIEYIPELRNAESPLNGTLVSASRLTELENRKIFAVTVNNHPKARPQYGLSSADLVMEVLAEGGITRYVPLFYTKEPTKIGPVRSIRSYILNFLSEYDSPVILHEGGASYNDSNEIYVRETDAVRDISEYHMKSMQTADSRYRDPEKGASAGYVHSLYTSYDLISGSFENVADYLGWERTTEIDPLKWKFDDSYEERGNGGKLDISFFEYADSWSKSGFEYNRYTNSYDRNIDDGADIDLENNHRISPKNVIIEWHDYRPANDGYARIIIEMEGENPVTIYRDGKVYEGTWKKSSRESRTHYYDETGQEIELIRGQIWKVIAVKSGTTQYSKISYNSYD